MTQPRTALPRARLALARAMAQDDIPADLGRDAVRQASLGDWLGALRLADKAVQRARHEAWLEFLLVLEEWANVCEDYGACVEHDPEVMEHGPTGRVIVIFRPWKAPDIEVNEVRAVVTRSHKWDRLTAIDLYTGKEWWVRPYEVVRMEEE